MIKFFQLILFIVLFPVFSLAQENSIIPKPVRKQLMGVQPELLREPYLQMGGPSTMTIRWRTNVYDRSRVKFGFTPTHLIFVKDDSTLVSEHEIKLSGLKPMTKYYYSIGGIADTILQGNSDNYFYTLPENESEELIRVAGFGDCGNNSPNQKLVRDQVENYIKTNPLNAWILMGDNAYSDGTDAEFQLKFFNIYKNDLLKHVPLYPVPGNHDYHDFVSASVNDQNKMAYFQNFTVPQNGELGGVPSSTESYYSFDIGNVHFLALDSYGPDNNGMHIYDQMGEQTAWVIKDLKANKKKWVVAYWHHPPYTKGSHDSDTETLLVNIRENFLKNIEYFGVDLVLNGHSHVYERTKLISGYFGKEVDFNAKKYEISSSSAKFDGSMNSDPYIKSSTNNKGTVYVVSGSAGAFGGQKETYPHDAMVYSNNSVGGAVILEVKGNRLDLKWLSSDGTINDRFTMMKNLSKADEELIKQTNRFK